jgi:hypothetical protein
MAMSTFKSKAVCRAVAVFAGLTLASGAAAHHGWAWTEDRETRLSGTIESISFGNPHMHIKLRNDAGLWAVDLSPPSQAQPSGFGPKAAKAGDRVTVTGHRARDGATRAFKGETVTIGGKTFDVYPQREKTLKPAA